VVGIVEQTIRAQVAYRPYAGGHGDNSVWVRASHTRGMGSGESGTVAGARAGVGTKGAQRGQSRHAARAGEQRGQAVACVHKERAQAGSGLRRVGARYGAGGAVDEQRCWGREEGTGLGKGCVAQSSHLLCAQWTTVGDNIEEKQQDRERRRIAYGVASSLPMREGKSGPEKRPSLLPQKRL
jgi:hypothetical protein